MVQLGITLFNADGEVPPAHPEATTLQPPAYLNNLMVTPCTWVFNFQFSLEEDMYGENSIALLKAAGADFEKHADIGIDPLEFGSLLITSGLVLSDDVHWISFHGGYDFAYLMKFMWCQALPNDEESFQTLVQKYFPQLVDVKFIYMDLKKRHQANVPMNPEAASMMSRLNGKGTLQDLADELGCQRFGSPQTCGTNAWMTGNIYFALRSKIYEGQIPEEFYGQMWGITSVGNPASATMQQAILALQSGGGMNGTNVGGMNFHSGTPSRDGAPSTPTTNPAGLATSTPGPQGSHPGMGTFTPGAGGIFGNFQYGK
ncbi:ribonuclease H-like protein [Eremomyces bilateralis CBS 781.70]|uniref:poly(A)-specific ribonuclease n=1 Tax=Eremomyces bilateralis CBS 781.70 TaxID=1392243 RepID=A0A6G1G6E0_9PEZI|nr:ribonuclease H-like protein [Eremomyces bilateralis CBS 781.70]KAF1813521.1 ribonuclease H-like protein [Eremomyces bilateralis CBS 781.70]